MLISRFLDNELNAAQREGVQEHLRLCETCRDFHQVLARNDEIIARTVEDHFGPKLAQAVMKRVAAEPKPAAPACPEPGRGARRPAPLAPRHWAVAAAILVCLFTGWAVMHNSRVSSLREQIAWLGAVDAELREKDRRAERGDQAELKMLMDELSEARQQIFRGAIHDFAQHRPELSAAYLSNGVSVTARFPAGVLCSSYDVLRREAGQEGFTGPINAMPLRRPEFTDLGARPGVHYEYKFVGRTPAGDVESLPVSLEIPADPADLLWEITCRDVDADNSAAHLAVMRDGLAETFRVPLGGPAGTGEFATGYTLQHIEESDETLTATIAWPMEDELGRPIFDAATGKRKVELQETLLSVRQNKKLVLRAPDGSRLVLWRQGRIRVPVSK